ncbi:MAG: hypothetical protein JJT89_06405 [Nitriliruptoraceae bacterium]|nr:hypothetical protein [Nitriliruptoraceae bacterium]
MSDHRGVPPDVEAKLHELERLVGEAKAVPLSASVMMNRVDIEGLVADLRDALPDELAQARWIIKERDEILDHARSDADRLLDDARTERDRLISEQEIVQSAADEAARIISEARNQGRQIRLEAEDYVDAKLANFEVVLNKTLGAVERGRAKLRGNLEHDQLGSQELDDDADASAADELEDSPVRD